MKLTVKKLREDAILPSYGSEDAAGFDLFANIDIHIPPQEKALIPTGISIDIPKGYELQIRPRSGVSLKTPVHICNSPGTIDSDYTGEIFIIVQNLSYITIGKEGELMTPHDLVIKKGFKIAQAVLAPVLRAEIEEGEVTKKTDRGDKGFGSTDSKKE